jgi:uncharacterized protein with ParB-like and HNH nuclease domain
MDISKVTIAQFFESPRRYLVPLFQRRYVWNKAGQWQPLWDDIVSQANAIAASRIAPNAQVRQHFMGAVVLGREVTGLRDVPTSLLVDGQQRLTTLSVLLAALRDILRAQGNEFMAQSLHRLIFNPPPLQDPVEAFKVWPTQGDRAAFQEAITAGAPELLKERYPPPRKKIKKGLEYRPPIIDAYLFFAEAITEYLGEKKRNADSPDPAALELTVDQRTSDLLDAVSRHLQFVAIELDEEEDPQVIFETLNARGVPLLPSDLIRNFLFLAAQRQDNDVQQLYDTFWKPFDGDWRAPREKRPFWQEMVKQGRLKRPRIDLFLFHFTTLSVRQDIRIEHLFTEFRGWWESSATSSGRREPGRLSNGDRSIGAELARLARFAGLFRLLQLPDLATRVGQFGYRLRAIDTSTVFPVVLTLLDRSTDLGRDDVSASLRDIESYLVRRMVCGLTTKNYNQVFLELLKQLDSRSDFSNQAIRSWLSDVTAASDYWPGDDEFRRAWLNEPVYLKLKPAKTRMVLEGIELESRTKMQETQEVPDELWVEHLLPQRPQLGDYPFAPNDSTSKEGVIERRARLLHSFGNLTLLTKALNKSVSNGPWSLKRPKIAAQSLLLMNHYYQRDASLEMWDEDSIMRRGEELFDVALRVWPGPVRTASAVAEPKVGSSPVRR